MGGIRRIKGPSGLERNVVLHVVELAPLLPGRRRRLALGRGLSARLAATFARARTRAEHLHPVANDLGRVALVAVLVLVLAGANPSLDVDLRPLLQVFASDLGQAPEEGDAVPLGCLLHLAARLVLPAVGGRNADVGD